MSTPRLKRGVRSQQRSVSERNQHRGNAAKCRAEKAVARSRVPPGGASALLPRTATPPGSEKCTEQDKPLRAHIVFISTARVVSMAALSRRRAFLRDPPRGVNFSPPASRSCSEPTSYQRPGWPQCDAIGNSYSTRAKAVGFKRTQHAAVRRIVAGVGIVPARRGLRGGPSPPFRRPLI